MDRCIASTGTAIPKPIYLRMQFPHFTGFMMYHLEDLLQVPF